MSKSKIAVICLIAWITIAAAFSQDYQNGYNDAWGDRKNHFLYTFNKDYHEGYLAARKEIEQMKPVADTLRQAKYEAGQTMDQMMVMLMEARKELEKRGWIAPSNQPAPPAGAGGGFSPFLSPSFLVAADFNSSEKQNNLGGDYGIWVSNPSDSRAWISFSFARDDAFGDPSGHALQLDYGFDSATENQIGFWMKLNGVNVTSHKWLSFYVKGDLKTGYPKSIRIVLKDQSGQPASFSVSGITDQWKKFTVPLSAFSDVKDWSSLGELDIVVDTKGTKPESGRIFLDHFSFSKE